MVFAAGLGRTQLGLQVCGGALRLAEVEARGRHWVLRASATRQLPAGLVVGGHVADPKALGEEIQQAYRSQPFRTRRAVVAISSILALCRSLAVPPVGKNALAALVEYGVQHELTVPFPDPVYDYVPPSPGKADGTRSVLVVAAPAQSVSALSAAARLGGLKPIAAEIPALALLRLLSMGTPLPEGGTSVILELGTDSTAIHFVRAGRLVHSHSRSRGGATGQSLRALAEGAHESAIRQSIQDITSELEQAIRFYLYGLNGRETPIDRVWVTGEGSSLPEIAAALRAEVDLPVEPMAMPGCVQRAPAVAEDAQAYTVAVGLALWGRV